MTKTQTASTAVDLTQIHAVLLDMDGVVYVGNRAVPHVQDFLNYLDQTERGWLCITNNATRTPQQFVDKLASMDVTITTRHVLSSASATATWLAQEHPERGKVLIIGDDGLYHHLNEEGFTRTDFADDADFVVAGMSRGITYDRLAEATLAIRNGAHFIGTNSDASFPDERGQLPGAGSLLALLETASGVAPTVIGKPNRGMFDQALRHLRCTAGETLMIGDRYETDIEGAIALGMPTAGVLTGVSTRDMLESADAPPAIIADDIGSILQMFRQADGNLVE